jgi:hypothetical protein
VSGLVVDDIFGKKNVVDYAVAVVFLARTLVYSPVAVDDEL